VQTPEGSWRLIVHDELAIEDGEYQLRTHSGITLPPAVVAKVLKKARQAGSSIIAVHSHPFPGPVRPSAIDLEGEARLMPVFERHVPRVPHARLIVGTESTHAGLLNTADENDLLVVQTVGEYLTEVSTPGRPERQDLQERADRQVRAFGLSGQQRLQALDVAIVGLGGTGSIVAQQLAHLGIGSFLLIDRDVIDPTSLNRVVGASARDVGQHKVEVARRMIAQINPTAKVQTVRGDIRDNITVRRLLDCGLFLCCTDSQGSRAVLTQFAYQYFVPGIDMGVVIDVTEEKVSHIAGRVQLMAPGLPCLVCSRVLDSEEVRRDLLTDAARAVDQYIPGEAISQPAVISINGAVASLAVTMMLAIVAGIPVASRHQRLRLESGIVSRVEGRPQPNCPVCSDQRAYGLGDSWPVPGRQA
jgi:hypothetical protein